MKNILKYIITFIILIIVFNILLLLVSLFPSSIIEKNVRSSSKILLKEGNKPQITKYLSVFNDNYTDVIMINACYSIDNNNPIFSYMSARKNYKEGLTTKQIPDVKGELISYSSENIDEIYNPVKELSEFLDSKVSTSIEYARYWHGYIVFLRLLLIFLDIQGIRNLLLMVFVVLFVLFLELAWKKIGIINTIIICFSLVIYDYFLVSLSLQGAPIFIVMMISSIILLIKIDKIKNIYLYFFIVACISNFVDFLTVPIITLAIPLYIYILYKQRKEEISFKQSIKTVLFSSIIWGLGYGITWITKWIIYDIIYNKGLIKSAFNQIAYRGMIYNPIGRSITVWDRLAIFFITNIIYFIIFATLAYGAIFIFLIIFGKKYKFKFTIGKKYIKEIIPLLIIIVIPVIWYILLSNHTILHTHFVYRNMIIVLVGELMCLKKIFIIEQNNNKIE